MTDQTPGTSLAPAQTRQFQRVENLQPMLDSGRFEHFQRAATALMHSSLLNPSVRGNDPRECFSNLMMIFDLSDRWKLPALSIAQCISIVHSKVVYEGKLIAAMLDASLGITLHKHYTGTRGTPDYRIFVSDRDWNELSEDDLAKVSPDRYPRGWRVIDGSVGEWRTFGKDGRTPNAAWEGQSQKNQLSYRGAREWCRLYEPAPLLGVYGDDEIEDMNLRMERARDVTPAPAGLSSGFTRPAHTLEDKPLLEGEAVETAQDAPQIAQEREDETPAPAEAQEKAQAQEKPTPAKKGKKAGSEPVASKAVTPGLDQPRAEALIEADPVADLDSLLEECRALGFAGTPMLQPVWVNVYQLGPKRWEEMREAWKEGAAAALEESLPVDDGADPVENDTGEDDDALDAISEAEPDLVETTVEDLADADDDAAFDDDQPDQLKTKTALDVYLEQTLPACTSWKMIKSALGILTKTPDWAAASPDDVAHARATTWIRQAALNFEGADKLDFISDLTAWRCWIETTDDVEAIESNWMSIVPSQIYQGLQPDQRANLQTATMRRIQIINAAADA